MLRPHTGVANTSPDSQPAPSKNENSQGRHANGLTTMQLKLIASLLLVLSVASTTLLPHLLGPHANERFGDLTVMVCCEIMSWAAVPLYAWFLTEGYRHTRSRFVYGLRLLILSVICEIPYELSTSGKLDGTSTNPVFALLVALTMIYCIDRAKALHSKVARITVQLLIAGASVGWVLLLRVGARQGFISLGALTIIFAFIFHILQEHENTMMYAAGIIGALAGITPACGVALLHFSNNTRGACTRVWIRRSFYAIYPALLIIGALIG